MNKYKVILNEIIRHELIVESPNEPLASVIAVRTLKLKFKERSIVDKDILLEDIVLINGE